VGLRLAPAGAQQSKQRAETAAVPARRYRTYLVNPALPLWEPVCARGPADLNFTEIGVKSAVSGVIILRRLPVQSDDLQRSEAIRSFDLRFHIGGS
jgi:hypothetical protein